MSQTLGFILISILTFFGSWLIYDLLVIFYWRPHGKQVTTITQEVQLASTKSIAFPFLGALLLGLLLGHLFLQF